MPFTRLSSSALRLTGADRVDFIQGQMTHDLRRAPTPGMVPAAFLNVRGQIEHFARVYRREDDVYLHLHAGDAAALAARLRKYIIFDAVEVTDLGEQLVSVHAWDESLPGWDPAGPDAQQFLLGEAVVLAARVNRTGGGGLDVHVLQAQADRLLASLGEERPAERLEHARVHAGIPDVTSDRWQGSLPQEVGLDWAVSYRKGCYVGQEIMARLEARGNARHRLAALEGTQLPSHAPVTQHGKTVGQAGHSVGERVLVKLRKEVAPGDTVEVGGVSARVLDVNEATPRA